MRRHTHAGAARMRAHEALPTTTYLDAGTPANAALAEIALCENLGDGDELVRLIGDLAESPMFVLLANEFLRGHPRAQGETEIAYRERRWYDLRLLAGRCYLAGRAEVLAG